MIRGLSDPKPPFNHLSRGRKRWVGFKNLFEVNKSRRTKADADSDTEANEVESFEEFGKFCATTDYPSPTPTPMPTDNSFRKFNFLSGAISAKKIFRFRVRTSPKKSEKAQNRKFGCCHLPLFLGRLKSAFEAAFLLFFLSLFLSHIHITLFSLYQPQTHSLQHTSSLSHTHTITHKHYFPSKKMTFSFSHIIYTLSHSFTHTWRGLEGPEVSSLLVGIRWMKLK